ncbi:MAG TPA: hypothetical protein H9815_11440 [Candidatus Ruania gallistercoris]|uniref:Conjugal transfer protein TrbC n=1 Tax=Candidatus Ruania gallistercoris TaxID=2838746 RepID=A0A9D2J4K8_9MICO|nr:hypothetical protein [Candidatus Ruania gallistercoris]
MSMLLTTAAAVVDVAAGLPDPAPVQPPNTGGIVAAMGWLKWVALSVCIAGLIAAGAMMAWQSRRGEGSEHAGKIAAALVGVIVISAATSLVAFLVDAA